MSTQKPHTDVYSSCIPNSRKLGATEMSFRRWMAAAPPGGWAVKNLPANAGDSGLIPESGRSPGEGNDKSLQYSCLINPRDRGAWWAAVHRVTEESDETEHTHGGMVKLIHPDNGIWFSTNKKGAMKPWEDMEGTGTYISKVKEPNLKRPYSMWFQLHHILRKATLWRQWKEQWSPELGWGEGWNNGARGYSGQWKNPGWYCNDEYTSLNVCPVP